MTLICLQILLQRKLEREFAIHGGAPTDESAKPDEAGEDNEQEEENEPIASVSGIFSIPFLKLISSWPFFILTNQKTYSNSWPLTWTLFSSSNNGRVVPPPQIKSLTLSRAF